MFNRVESYDELMDAFAKEVKEAPGWASLLILCTQLPKLLPPELESLRTSLGIQVEGHALATPMAITLFLIGDILDTFVFPRLGKDRRKQKFLPQPHAHICNLEPIFGDRRGVVAGGFRVCVARRSVNRGYKVLDMVTGGAYFTPREIGLRF